MINAMLLACKLHAIKSLNDYQLGIKGIYIDFCWRRVPLMGTKYAFDIRISMTASRAAVPNSDQIDNFRHVPDIEL